MVQQVRDVTCWMDFIEISWHVKLHQLLSNLIIYIPSICKNAYMLKGQHVNFSKN